MYLLAWAARKLWGNDSFVNENPASTGIPKLCSFCGMLEGCATLSWLSLAVQCFVTEGKRKKVICVNWMEVRKVTLQVLGKDQSSGIVHRA